jgi:hypothetical protein
MKLDTKELNNNDLWIEYIKIHKELERRKLININNVIGRYGEFLALEKYNSSKKLSHLKINTDSEINIDALNSKKERYIIKTILEPSNRTSVFYVDDKKVFDYVIIVHIAKDYKLIKIVELTWEQFLEFRKWNKVLRGWSVNIG